MTVTEVEAAIAAELLEWWEAEIADWDTLVSGDEASSLPAGADLWSGMPEVDSKAIARTSHIFDRHLGVPVNPKLIRPGGYASIDEVIEDLVPKMVAEAASSRRTNRKR